MEKRRSRREERKEETRTELVAAAARVFARRGFHGASIEEIAREAGFTTGAVYWHFSGKDDLFLAVYEAYATTRVAEWEEIHQNAEGELPERARAYADQWMERLRRDPDFMVLSLEFLVHAWRNPELRAAFGHRSAFGRIALARIIETESERRGYELPMAAEELATALRELGSGLALAKLADPEGIPDRLFGDFVELFFELMARPAHAAGSRRPRGARA
jgi:AcrR family transcriptional regulator